MVLYFFLLIYLGPCFRGKSEFFPKWELLPEKFIVLKVQKGYCRAWLTASASTVIYYLCKIMILWFFMKINNFFFFWKVTCSSTSPVLAITDLYHRIKLLSSHSLNQIGIEVVYGFTSNTKLTGNQWPLCSGLVLAIQQRKHSSRELQLQDSKHPSLYR